MSATKHKRRTIDRAASQSQIPFAQTKHQTQDFFQMSAKPVSRANIDCCFATPDSIFNGAKSPYRSGLRIRQLMKNSPSFSQIGQVMNLDTPASQLHCKRTFSQTSKPSSVTTAYTSAPSEFSVSKSFYSQRSKIEQYSDMKQSQSSNSKIVGQKRQAEKSIDSLEFNSRIRSKAGKYVLQNIRLRNKITGQVMEFSLVDETKVEALRNAIVSDFNTSNLEVEYDYATDSEQMSQSKKMLFEELAQAIEFFIKEDPLKLVDNIFL